MIKLFSSLIHPALFGASETGRQTTIMSAGQDVLGAKAGETMSAGIFPLEVAFIVLGCLVVSGILLLMREARMENREN